MRTAPEPSAPRSARERLGATQGLLGSGTLEVCYIDWHIHPFRAERWYELWEPAAGRAMAFGAKSWSLTRSSEDPLLFRQASVWEDRADFERYWYSDEVAATREQALNYFNKPLHPVWHALVAGE
jgi:quinol monooxygenase YgiN